MYVIVKYDGDRNQTPRLTNSFFLKARSPLNASYFFPSPITLILFFTAGTPWLAAAPVFNVLAMTDYIFIVLKCFADYEDQEYNIVVNDRAEKYCGGNNNNNNTIFEQSPLPGGRQIRFIKYTRRRVPLLKRRRINIRIQIFF